MKKNNNQINFLEMPVNSTSELKAAKKFYNEVFEWSFQDWGDDYADTQDSGIASGINADTSHKPSTPLPVIYVNDIEKTLKKVEASGGTVIKNIFSFPGGKRFHFKDPSGNELAVWSEK